MGQEGGDALLQGALPLGGEPLAEASLGFAGGPHHHQAILPGYQVGAGAKYHPAQGPLRCLQRQHLTLHRKNRQLWHQLATPGAAGQHRFAAAEGLLFPLGRAPLHCLQLAAASAP